MTNEQKVTCNVSLYVLGCGIEGWAVGGLIPVSLNRVNKKKQATW